MLLLRRHHMHPFSSGGWEYVYSELRVQVSTPAASWFMPAGLATAAPHSVCRTGGRAACSLPIAFDSPFPAPVLPVPLAASAGQHVGFSTLHWGLPLLLNSPSLTAFPSAPASAVQHIGGGELWLGVPSVIEHRVDSRSPLHGMGEGDIMGAGGADVLWGGCLGRVLASTSNWRR